MLLSWGLLALGTWSLIALVSGIALLDMAFQGAHINHQRTIYALRPDARSRLNTAYMVAFFFGGVFGASFAIFTYDSFGWIGDCVLGAVLALLALLFWAATWKVGLVEKQKDTPITRPGRN